MQLLAVAERLFLADGYDAVSVRAICAAADANPAAVHYHFGSKEGLTVALLEDRLAPLWADPLAGVEPGSDSIAHVVEVIIRPLVELQADPLGQLHLQLLSRFALTRPDAEWTGRWFRLDAWSPILAAAVGDLDDETARRRWALAFELIMVRVGRARSPLRPAAVAALIDFVTAGLSAPVHDSRPTAPSAHRSSR
ncbi:helix-turn-helix domain-containing protein [Gordonia sp. ABSL1-1]|uniref:TetR/AcrR family transcriptional regulator n=1 Tax=Gordonia sp. ABSL1-1 TaxID=3053923 RepID=UPI0025730311|nr:TetR/AcrR family transcriptional regulator [Gordonia sp. ABSL1-1]MDL9936944.1 helix-turn-helix domain-containing protein [Gordonia sp. ABSL1-1]